jgi:lipopolysaccharide transport system ATP-binding protein
MGGKLSETVITIKNLSKSYELGHQSTDKVLNSMHVERFPILPKQLIRNAKNFIRGNRSVDRNEVEEFWALNDVTLSINRGEVLGIIGRNGSGKSTLLKILSRITKPTGGRVTIVGKVSSLLEVGTGFHPELTGRENIFLNGAILGMTKKEVALKFDEIVSFAEISKFLDTPVKRYSSGMYVKLAFSVAAHLEPDIMIIDEVLAVGDASFQKKCLGKISDVSRAGRTVLFVSHNMGVINNLCTRALLLENGQMKYLGDVNTALKMYSEDATQVPHLNMDDYTGDRRGLRQLVEIKSISIFDENMMPQSIFSMGETIIIHIQMKFKHAIKEPIFGILFRNMAGTLIHDFRSSFDGYSPNIKVGITTFEIIIPKIHVYPGYYTLGAWIQQQLGVASDDYINQALKIMIVDRQLIGSPNANFELISKEGTEVYHPCDWRMIQSA